MTSKTNESISTKVIFPCRFSYVHVWEPASMMEGEEKKYSVSCILPKADASTIGAIKAAIRAAYQAGVATRFEGKRPRDWKNPLRDGDTDRQDDEAYADSLFLYASCKTRPGVVGHDRQPITRQDEFYSGCYGYVSINFYPFNTGENLGVAAGLNHVMKLKDGSFLGGRATAESDFADIDPLRDPFASADDPFPENGGPDADIFG